MKQLLFLLSFISFSALAQQSIKSKVEYKPVPNTNEFAITLKLTVSDTLVSQISVKINSEDTGSGDLFDKTFTSEGDNVDGTSMHRTGNTFTLSLGRFGRLQKFYGQSVITYSNQETSTINFSR